MIRKFTINRNERKITYHPTPEPGYESLVERIFGREMREIKKGIGGTIEYRTNKIGRLESQRPWDDESQTFG